VVPVIYGCEGLTPTPEEINFYSKAQPLGFILFERNCQSPAQVKALIKQLKACVSHANVPILIDQEGGRVVRLKPPHWLPRPAAKTFTSAQAVYENAISMAYELAELGITVDCAPCADLLIEGADDIIGDRAFSADPNVVTEFSIAMLKGLEGGGIIPVIKHMPGHGRAPVDSHEELPVVETDLATLRATDFLPFKALAAASKLAWGMTAHVIYSDIDPVNVATQSKDIINTIIRTEIGFSGFLVSDCLTMKALTGTFEEKARKSMQAGCDALLMCKGTVAEFESVAHGSCRSSDRNF
jgi:beta-N-acetylhexosaminidase